MQSDCTQADIQVEHVAAELFQMAALLLGNEAEAVSAVEETLRSIEVDPCADPAAAQADAQRRLIKGCIARAQVLYRGALVAPADADGGAPATCIETEDLSAAGFDPAQIAALLGGSGREPMRRWLESLQPAARVVFVLRVMLGQDGEQSAGYLRAAGTGDWTSAQVSGRFREALCALSNSLVHASVPAVA